MSSDGTVNIMLVDDHAIVREGYRTLLQKQPGLRVIAEAADGAEAYRLYKEIRPDLIIIDLTMPGLGGIEALKRIRQWDRNARILVFTMHQSAAYALQAIRAGAKGYVTKSSPPQALIDAVFDVLKGRMALSPDIDHEIAETLHISPKTVANTRYLIKSKLGVETDIALVRLALRQGLLAMPEGDAQG
jgi:two-component system invasion response regulator UvrY